MKQEIESTNLTRSESGTGGVREFLRLFLSGNQYREGLGLWRFCAVVAGFSPLFILLAVRGNDVIPNTLYVSICVALSVFPLILMVFRFAVVYRSNTPRPIPVGRVEDSRSHILGYLFATLLPFYRQELADTWDLVAIVMALIFIVFLFWHLNLHYVNILLAVLGYRVYTVYPPDDDNPYTSRVPIVVVTRRHFLAPGEVIQGYRLSDTLYWGLQS